ncbi:MAG: lipid-binding SYLF domain-containing protein [Armatimonadota bacterium]
MKKVFLGLLVALMVFSFCAVSYAEETVKQQEQQLKIVPEEQTILDAEKVFQQINNVVEMGIPRGLVYAAQAIAIFPKTQGGGLIIGGMSGKGVILYKNPETNKWSAPAFLKIGGASIGFQAGVHEVDIVLLVMDKNSVEGLLQSRFKLGVDGGIAIGPAGRDADIGADLQAKSIIYSYSRSRGAYIGLKLQGTTIWPNSAANEAVYGKPYDTKQIIVENVVKPTVAGEQLIQVIEKYTKK